MKPSQQQLAECLKSQLDVVLKELTDLRTALNTYAIVAVTDKNGVIIEVNEKFCQISGFSRAELLGKTHRMINSGHHSKKFFDNLWSTISSGKVWQGEICNKTKEGELYWVATSIIPFSGDDGTPVRYINIHADITQSKLAEVEARKMAFYDTLTHLPNRRLFKKRIQQARQSMQSQDYICALLLIDIDDFKEVNDMLGHNHGDELLCLIAERLRQSIRASDTVARLGGDEFVVLLEHLDADLECALIQAEHIVEKLCNVMTESFFCIDKDVYITVSIGFTLFNSDARQLDIIKQADTALYRAKDRGRNRVALFDTALQVEVEKEAKLMAELRKAVAHQEFCLFYQPVANAAGVVEGYEALLRWKHPERGLVTPAGFIEQLEKSNLILRVGKWVLQTACSQLAVWGQDRSTEHLTLAINISAKQFLDSNFVSDVKLALTDSNANPRRLYLELTECTFYRDINQLIEKMKHLRCEGIRFSLDDFGTGYSALNYLKRLPLDCIKIDQSFVRNVPTDPNDTAIVRCILELARVFCMDVIAEGVETIEQADFLHSIGCMIYQGYLFGKPMSLDELPCLAELKGERM